VHFNAGKYSCNFLEFLRGEGDRGCFEVVLDAMRFGRSGNRDDPGLLRQEPGKGDLHRGRAFAPGDVLYGVNDRLVGLSVLGMEPRIVSSVVVAAEGAGATNSSARPRRLGLARVPPYEGFFLYYPSRAQIAPKLRVFIDCVLENARGIGMVDER
jgi:DNA-binding transcriptional LysR family regulator